MAELNYSSYLQTDVLLSLQRTRIPATADRTVVLAEHFFIVAHQSCELWLKQVVADLSLARDLLSSTGRPADTVDTSVELLQRSAELLRVLHEQVLALERLPLRHFVRFRPYLGTASGAQSQQFMTVGELLGDSGEEGELYRAFEDCADHHGCTVAEVCRLGITGGGLHRVAEALLDVGNGYWRWKVAHLGLMSKMVGGQRGTGGTTGEEYLMRRITLPFPELRRLRGALHAEELAASPA
ncbi:tryptophan 2,3-dioxygenase family protein [Streptomyces rubradiris]|uniref:Tryptophan 2,3-dioxygenase n=1 Tax=Streptomyces rubradiris TaxID=285531 RepID=A0ABQ3RLI6_STRRR|nr:tryptophan 2,3-dioxygenase family protein [Streptomyces rubradiris]GHH10544.1 tryptophan 2,3-dioxygenase [Streptomyces rubradiris]GHI56612.1 tryptophan 2,3-dioxygenase [Streptomyces rubradiris]